MSISGHNGVGVFLCDFAERFNKLLYKRLDLFYFIAQIKPNVKSHLVVSRTRGVKPLAYIAKTLCKFRFNKHVDILGIGVEYKSAAFDIGEYFAKSADNR